MAVEAVNPLWRPAFTPVVTFILFKWAPNHGFLILLYVEKKLV